MNKVLILGVNGFTGRHFQDYIIREKLDQNYSFIGADRKIEQRVGIDYRQTNLVLGENLRKLIEDERPDYIMNFTGIFNDANFRAILTVNSELPRKILDIISIRGFPLKNILLIGSAAEYGSNDNLPLKEDSDLCPVSFYGLSKVIQTHYAGYYHRNYRNINVNVARTFNIIGSGMSTLLSIPLFFKQIEEAKDGGSIYVGNLNTKRDFLDISDVIDAYWKILIGGERGRIYNLCRGKSVKIKDILQYMILKSGKKLHVIVEDNYLKTNDILDSYGDNSKLVRDTGWNCRVSINDAIDKLIHL